MKKILVIILILFFSFGKFTSVFGEESCEYKVVSDKYDSIYNGKIYSIDGNKYSFTAKNEGIIIVIKDGINIGGDYKIIGELILSNDKKSYLFIVEKDGKKVVIKDGLESKKYDNIYFLKYGPKGKSYSFVAEINGKEIVVKDGIEGKEYDKIEKTLYSPNGKYFTFIVKKEGLSFIVRDGIEKEEYSSIFHYTLKYSLNNEDLLYKAMDKNLNELFIYNGKNIKTDIDLDYTDYVYNGINLSYIIFENDKQFITNNGIQSNKYDIISTLIYSNDGKSYSFIAEKDGKKIVVKDGIESNKYDSIINYSLSYSGKLNNLSFIAKQDGKDILVINGIESEKYDSISSSSLRYGLDGKKYSFDVIKNGKSIIIKNKKEISKFDNIGGGFFLNNKNFTFLAQENGKSFIVQEVCVKIIIKNLKLKSKVLFFKDLILSKKDLEKTSKGKIFKLAVDKRISSLNDEKLVQFYNLLGKIDLDSSKYKKYKLVLEYMKAKIGLEIWNREDVEKEMID